jgi:hypothetical protein
MVADGMTRFRGTSLVPSGRGTHGGGWSSSCGTSLVPSGRGTHGGGAVVVMRALFYQSPFYYHLLTLLISRFSAEPALSLVVGARMVADEAAPAEPALSLVVGARMVAGL